MPAPTYALYLDYSQLSLLRSLLHTKYAEVDAKLERVSRRTDRDRLEQTRAQIAEILPQIAARCEEHMAPMLASLARSKRGGDA